MRKAIVGVCLAVLLAGTAVVSYRAGARQGSHTGAQYDASTGAYAGDWPTYQGRPAAEYFAGHWTCPSGWDVFGIESRPSEDEKPDAVCVR